MLKTLNTTILILVSCIAFSQPAVQQFTNNPILKHASVGISVVDISSGRSIVSHNAEKSLTPASVLKLVTTATAIETLGDNYRYRTEVAFDANDPSRILVIGAGDPTLGSEVFSENPNGFFVNSLQLLNKSLSKDRSYSLYIVDNLFGYEGVSPEWTWIDLGNYYASGSYGISIFDNSYRLFFNTVDKKSCPVIVRTEPQIKGLTFRNELKLNNTGRDNGYIYGAPFSYDRALRGDIPGGRTSFSIKGDIPDPGLLLGETLADHLRKAGYKVGEVKTAREDYLAGMCSPLKAQPAYKVGQSVFTQLSRPLYEIVREVNVESNNHYAEHLIRTVGRNVKSDIYENALDAGIEYTGEFWKTKGIENISLQMHDGSGLAPQNAVSPKFLTDLLIYMHNDSKYSEAFISSLPKSGQDGTLRGFMRNTKYTGKIVAKSGSIGGVQCYAGYLSDGNKKYAFAIMVNKFNGTNAQVRAIIEQFLLSL
ncbi:MAG: D-alanyl-D-alanine carboxypeptidase/D-alanyl-D-alanine-endopeptidase [Fermentimonas sp.]|nr:D-alanyl-D-alanine carboxypeptidase/D-alanyl-D-alanine-endopeptidase [Fermentimonas sp.]